ncbi:hypothetical protein ACF0H5_006641 [Mactra antiquata]
MQFDLLFEELGEYGCFQRLVLWSAASVNIWSGLLLLTSVFVLAVPDHRCAIPGWENDTFTIQNDQHQAIINNTIPLSNTDDELLYDQCHYYNVDHHGNRTLEQCSTWVYDMSIYKTSLAADFNMVCDGAVMKSNAQMVTLFGILVGSLVTGLISDKLGRKTTMCGSLSVMLVCSLAMAWSPNYTVFIILTFMSGFLNVGFWMPSFVISMEFVGPSHRKLSIIFSGMVFTTGTIALTGLAYLIREWNKLLLLVSLFGIIYVPLWLKCVFPESVRWLCIKGRREEAKDVIETWAKWNKLKLSENFFDKVFAESDEDEPQRQTQGSILNMFTSRVLFMRTTVIFLLWIIVTCGYYGLAFNAGDLGSDLYLNFLLQTVVELPSTLLCYFLLDRIGRKPLTVGSMIVGGVALLGTIFTLIYLPDTPTATTVLALIGKMGITAGFSAIYVFSAELFPTVVRNAGMGASSSMGRIGGMVSPYIADLDRLVGGSFGKALPQIVFAAITLAGGIAALVLPETLNKELPESFEDAKKFGNRVQKKRSKEEQLSVNGLPPNPVQITKF